MTGPVEITQPKADATDYAPTILPGFGPFTHIEQFSLGPGEFSHYGIMPDGKAVPLENFAGGVAAGPGTPGQAAPAPQAEAPAARSAMPLMLGGPQTPAPPSMLPAGAAPPLPAALPAAPPGPPPMAPLRIAEDGETSPAAAEPAEPAPQARPGPGSALAADGVRVQGPDGKVIQFPAGMPMEDINKAMRNLYTSSQVPLAKGLDRSTGAPVSVRGAVGIATTPEDRLATLRKFYPDAQPYEKDNFVFKHPKTGRATLYNEDNPLGGWLPTMGDIASIGPEIAETAGGVIGGGLAAASTPFTMGAGAAAVPAGVGLGALTGRKLWDGIVGPMSGTVDTRGGFEKGVADATTATLNGVAGPVMQKGAKLLGAAFGPAVDYGRRAATAGPELFRAFQQSGIPTLLPAVTGNKATQTLWHGVGTTLGGANRIIGATERTRAALRDEVDDLAQRYARGDGANPGGMIRGTESLGDVVTQNTRRAGQKFSETIRDKLRPAVDMAIGPDTRVGLPNLRMLRGSLQRQLDQAPASQEAHIRPALREIDRLLADEAPQAASATAGARPPGIPYRFLRYARTALGKNLRRPDVSGYTEAQSMHMRRVYDAMRQDIFHAAEAADRRLVAAGQQPVAVQALRAQDRYVRLNRNVNLPTLQAVENRSANADKVWKLLDNWSKEGGVELRRLRRSMAPKDWDEIAGTMLQRLGVSKGSAGEVTALDQGAGEFSALRFIGRFGDLKPEARMAIWGGTRYRDLMPELERLLTVTRALNNADALRNTSGTGRVLGIVTGLASAAEYLVLGDLKHSAGVFAGGVAAPHVIARLMTSPRFVRWLCTGLMMTNPNSIKLLMPGLMTIAKEEPDIREAIHQFIGSWTQVEQKTQSPQARQQAPK